MTKLYSLQSKALFFCSHPVGGPWENLLNLSPYQQALILHIYATFMFFNDQFVFKAKTAWEEEMGDEFTKDKREERIDRAH